MIKNENQYQITKAYASKFQQALDDIKLNPPDIHPILIQAQIDSLNSQLSDLQAELSEYEALQSSNDVGDGNDGTESSE